MKEICKSIKGLEGRYKISNIGNAYSSFIKSTKEKGAIYGNYYKIIKPTKMKNGYMTISVKINGKSKRLYIHRLVSQTFIKNIDNKPIINHKDGNKLNNNVENLEWCSYSENNLHSYRILKNKPTQLGNFGNKNPNHKKINQYDYELNFIKLWQCEADVERELNINKTNISACCHHRRKTTGGYVWRFANE